jgi:hypothetical protein
VTAQIFAFSDYRNPPADPDPIEIDLVTAVDVAIRDLRDILTDWGSAASRQRAEECETMLRHAFRETIANPTASQP